MRLWLVVLLLLAGPAAARPQYIAIANLPGEDGTALALVLSNALREAPHAFAVDFTYAPSPLARLEDPDAALKLLHADALLHGTADGSIWLTTAGERRRITVHAASIRDRAEQILDQLDVGPEPSRTLGRALKDVPDKTLQDYARGTLALYLPPRFRSARTALERIVKEHPHFLWAWESLAQARAATASPTEELAALVQAVKLAQPLGSGQYAYNLHAGIAAAIARDAPPDDWRRALQELPPARPFVASMQRFTEMLWTGRLEGRREAALALISGELPNLRDTPRCSDLVAILLLGGEMAANTPQEGEARRFLSDALFIAQRHELKAGHLLSRWMQLELDEGQNLKEAEAITAEAIKQENRRFQQAALGTLSLAYLHAREAVKAEAAAQTMHTVAMAAKDGPSAGMACMQLAAVHIHDGDSRAALQWYDLAQQAVGRSPGTLSDWVRRWSEVRRAEVMIGEGAANSATTVLAEAQKRMEAAGDTTGLHDCLLARGHAALALSQAEEAIRLGRAALAQARRSGTKAQEARDQRLLAMAYNLDGQVDAARRATEDAVRLATEIGLTNPRHFHVEITPQPVKPAARGGPWNVLVILLVIGAVLFAIKRVCKF